MPLPSFPKLNRFAGWGMSDKDATPAGLADKFDYTNTF